jgi:Fic family protein
MSDICLLYLWIMSIHPFIDGNGRVAELIIWKELIANNHIPVILNKHVYAELALIGNQFSKNQIGVLQGFVLFCAREQKRFQMYARMAPGSRYPWFIKLV